MSVNYGYLKQNLDGIFRNGEKFAKKKKKKTAVKLRTYVIAYKIVTVTWETSGWAGVGGKGALQL